MKDLIGFPTPRPWKAVLLHDHTDSTYIEGPDFAYRGDIEVVGDKVVGQERIHADAALIVEAVNERDSLKAEVERKAERIRDLEGMLADLTNELDEHFDNEQANDNIFPHNYPLRRTMKRAQALIKATLTGKGAK